jgi:PPK2 family polyphosphate:nucleotide phosphotransferase
VPDRPRLDRIVARARELSRPYRVSDGRSFRLRDVDPSDTGDLRSSDKSRAERALEGGIHALAELQDRLYAQDQWSVLLVFQALDAAGKDSAIKHVMSGVNPQGCQVFSFKAPSAEELDHDFLWRTTKALPERGRIGIFNRSYYEEVLVVRVHPELLAREKLPAGRVDDVWKNRFRSIRAFERHLDLNGTLVRKFFLHVSRDEQRRRFLARLDDPGKRWKFSSADLAERSHWNEYQSAYESMIRHTATKHAPWYVVPADAKWYTRLVVAAAIVDALDALDPRYPEVEPERRAELARARRELEQTE